MKNSITYSLLFLFLITFFTVEVKSQNTVFKILKDDLILARECFDNGNFQCALDLYLNEARKNKVTNEVKLQIARCYFLMKQFNHAVEAYQKVKVEWLSLEDVYNYAEALTSLGRYAEASEGYREYLNRKPDDALVIQKLWRLDNIQFLFEDSIHYAVRPVTINTQYGELCPVPYKNGIVFMSNRKLPQLVAHLDASSNTPFYRLFYSKTVKDSVTHLDSLSYEEPLKFGKGLNTKFHVGPVAFYDNEQKMVFSSTGNNAGKTLQLHFAELINDEWEITEAFPHNSATYSVSDPSINSEGTVLYFSSDMEGGFGGRDIYRSFFNNGKWSKPENLGNIINTSQDESFPFLHLNKALYFSSNGHPGLGGLDIFKAEITEEGFGEVQNLGYPMNTHHDDFGMVLDTLSTHGYLSSNRSAGAYNDDIYEFDMDIQTYPLDITGVIRFRENLRDSAELRILPNAKLHLIDNIKNTTVAEGLTDSLGNFTITVPYFSKYIIKIMSEEIKEGVVSFEIPKYRKLFGEYVIVLVKDTFISPDEEELK